MNLLKKFIRNDDVDMESEDFDNLYVDEDIRTDLPEDDPESAIASLDSPTRKEPDFKRATGADKVSLKLLQPKSHKEATVIADKLKEGSIVLLDIGNLSKEQARRLVDFLAGVAYVLGGEMIKSNRNTIIVSPSGVDISGFAAESSADESRYNTSEEVSDSDRI